MLSAIIEKRNLNSKSDSKTNKELTTVTMPPALIEGFETFLLFTAMFIFNSHLVRYILLKYHHYIGMDIRSFHYFGYYQYYTKAKV